MRRSTNKTLKLYPLLTCRCYRESVLPASLSNHPNFRTDRCRSSREPIILVACKHNKHTNGAKKTPKRQKKKREKEAPSIVYGTKMCSRDKKVPNTLYEEHAKSLQHLVYEMMKPRTKNEKDEVW